MKKKTLVSFLTLALLLLTSLNLTSIPAQATTSSTSAGTYGTLTGSSSGGGQYAHISTRVSKAAHLYMHSTIQHNDTGAYIGTPAPYEGYGTTSIDDEIDMAHWNSSFINNHTYAMYTTHELIGTTNYVVYTVCTGNYTP